MFGIPKSLPLCLLLSFTGLISMLLLSLLFLRPFSHFHSRRKLCVRHAAAVPVIGKFSDAALKWFFCLLRAWRSESSFSYSPQEITAADVEIISLPDTSSSQHTLLNSLFPHTVVMCPFKPCRKFGTQGLFALTFTDVLTTENDSVCVRAWWICLVLLTCKCCSAETWIHYIAGAFNETWL